MNEIFLTQHADGEVTPEHFGIRKVEIPHSTPDGFDGQSIPENHVIVKILSMSVDPYMRSRMTPPGPGYLRKHKSIATNKMTKFHSRLESR